MSVQPSPSFFFLTVGLALSVPSVAGRCTPATGCAGRGAASTTWPVSPVSPARGSFPLVRSLAWWRAGCSAAATTTSCWTTSAGPQKMVHSRISDVLCSEKAKGQGRAVKISKIFWQLFSIKKADDVLKFPPRWCLTYWLTCKDIKQCQKYEFQIACRAFYST